MASSLTAESPKIRPEAAPFLLAAWTMAGLYLAGLAPDGGMEVALVAIAATLGLPHGALDILLLTRFPGWGRVAAPLAYAALSLLVVLAWVEFPTLTLGAFLLISWFHFGTSDSIGPHPILEGVVRGAAPLCLPALAFPERLAELFAMLVPAQGAESLAGLLALAAWPWLAAFALALIQALLSRAWWLTLELVTLAALFALVTPLLAFAIYFPLLHATRSLATLRRTMPDMGYGRLIWAGLWPSLLVVAVALATLAVLGPGEYRWDAHLVQVVFVGLAAVTFPHVALWLLVARKAP